MRVIATAMRAAVRQWFPQRNLIVVSEHRMRHIPISSGLQVAMLLVLAGGVCWAAYSTGSYMAARGALKAQSQALRSIAGARVASNFNNALYPSAQLIPNPAAAEPVAVSAPESPMFSLSALDNDRLFARVAFLEQKVADLQATNNSIVQRIRIKAAGRINDLEDIIKQAGLSPATLKKAAAENAGGESPAGDGKSEGGPYIPADLAILSGDERLLFNHLDELALLQDVVETMPLAEPIRNYEEQSRFGNRIDPFTGRLAFHAGLDLSGAPGTKILSTAGGVVTAAERNGAYGNMVDIDHGFGISTRYAHLSQMLVTPGQRVKKGQAIGVQGSTGRSTGNHLHYEVRYNDRPLNPKNFLKAGQEYVSKE